MSMILYAESTRQGRGMDPCDEHRGDGIDCHANLAFPEPGTSFSAVTPVLVTGVHAAMSPESMAAQKIARGSDHG
ncbi:hypothetical protein GTW25_12840 [Aliihoeflea aestuarii]|jgi:hypothetical protein|uniref:hypothetical protein n=1 Tax=Aliihoeflea aestuarii TaxID=453840 RepID=UPI002091F04A|nr:hypothetical protein [Aliihoeflea aestuarii]MCO6391917.1 hypothetical protein [Aliihoeflea aestuarii]